MSALFLLFGILAGGLAAWQLVKSSEQTRYSSRIRDLESKFRFAQGEVLTLKEQLTTARAQTAAAEKTLADERAAHTTALAAMASSLKRGILALTTIYFAVGLAAGGSAGWLGAGWKWRAQETGEKFQIEMAARTAELKAELLEKQLNQLEEASGFFERALREERVARAVAMTKLQILLESIVPQRSGQGLILDEQKLKKNLKDKIEIETSPQDLPVLRSAPRL